MVPLEDFMEPSRGGATPSKGGNIISEDSKMPSEEGNFTFAGRLDDS